MKRPIPAPTGFPRDRYCPSAWGRIHYLDMGGRGPQVHFLHANGFCAGAYRPFLHVLGADLHIVASDVRGQGDSRPPPGRVRRWSPFAEDLAHFVQHAMTPPVVAMGHSLGAVLTWIAAARRPHLFRAIVLLDPVFLSPGLRLVINALRAVGLAGWFPLARGARRRKRRFADVAAARRRFAGGKGMFKTWRPEFVDAYLACALGADAAGVQTLKCDPEVEAQFFETVPFHVWAWAPRITCPVLVLRGQRSDTFRPAAARRMAAVVPSAQVVEVPRTGHFLPMERPEACARRIRSFLRGHGLLDGAAG